VATTVLALRRKGAARRTLSKRRALSLRWIGLKVTGKRICGDADKNEVTIGGQSALVLASFPGFTGDFAAARSSDGACGSYCGVWQTRTCTVQCVVCSR